MIDTNELRWKANSTNIVDHIDLHTNIRPIISEILDRLEAAEKEAASWKGLAKQFGNEADALRAKIEAMEKQEPAGYGVLYVEAANGEEDWDSIWKHRVFAEDHVKDLVQAYSDLGESIGAITVVPLCALLGAKGEEK